LGLLKTPNPQPYIIRWLLQGWYIFINQQCCLPYNIKPFTDEVLCYVSPLEFCDVLLGQPFLWKNHVMYESIPHTVIITLGRKIYRVLEVAPPISISLISTKQCSKIISLTGKFVFFSIFSQSKDNIMATSMAST